MQAVGVRGSGWKAWFRGLRGLSDGIAHQFPGLIAGAVGMDALAAGGPVLVLDVVAMRTAFRLRDSLSSFDAGPMLRYETMQKVQ